MSFQGDISSISLSDLVQNLAANKKTGKLRILSGNGEWHVLFREGKVVSYADNQGFSIGEWLVEKEPISEAQLEEALRRYNKAKKKTLGEILRDLGLLDLDDYKTYLSKLIQETLYEVLSFPEGSFELLEGELDEGLPHREAIALGIEFAAPALVMEAARRSDDWQKIRTHIPSENEMYIVPPAGRERLLAEAGDDVTKEAIQLMDGTRSLRQVIGKLPYSRFDACRALAHLIAEKKAKPMDGSVLGQLSKKNEDPRKVIACLKAILEREPNNRQILDKLADLHAAVGQRDESATCRKLLAISRLDDGDLKGAEQSLRQSIEQNPRDIATWQKLLDTIRRQGDGERLAVFGAELAEHFKKLGLMEIARDHLADMAKTFPGHLKFKLDLADARFALGEHKASVDELMALGVDLLRKQNLDEAESIFGRILKYDRENQKAKQLFERIRSGKIARRKAFKRRAARVALLSCVLASLTSYLVYDFIVRGELFRITREVYAESLLETGRHDEAISRVKSLRERHPFSYAGSYESRLLLETLEARKKSAEKEHAPSKNAKDAAPPKSDPLKASKKPSPPMAH